MHAVTIDREKHICGTVNDNGKDCIIHFVHEDSVDGNVRITIKG